MKTTSCRHHQGREGGGGGGGKGKGGKGGKEEEKAEADKDDKDVKSLSRRCRGRMPWKGKATNLGLGQHTGNNHLLFFYFVSLHISRPQKKRNAGKVVLVERAVQRRVLGEQSCLIYFYFTAPNTACGEEGVEVEYYSTSSSTSATVSTVFGEQGAWNPGPQRARVRRQPWEVPLITRRSDPRTFKCSLHMISRKRNRKRDIFEDSIARVQTSYFSKTWWCCWWSWWGCWGCWWWCWWSRYEGQLARTSDNSKTLSRLNKLVGSGENAAGSNSPSSFWSFDSCLF